MTLLGGGNGRRPARSTPSGLAEFAVANRLQHLGRLTESGFGTALRDPDDYDWIPLTTPSATYGQVVLDETILTAARDRSRQLYWTNPNAHGLMELVGTFVSGAPGSITWGDTKTPKGLQEECEELWSDWCRRMRWTELFGEYVVACLRDGELIARREIPRPVRSSHPWARGPWLLNLRQIHPEDVTSPTGRNIEYPMGIRLLDDDPLYPIEYAIMRRSGSMGQTANDFDFRPAQEILHYRILQPRTALRGVPWLFVIAETLRQASQLVKDRTQLNRLRNQVGVIFKHKLASAQQVQTFAQEQASRTAQRTLQGATGETTEYYRQWRGPGYYDLPANTDIEFVAPNLGAIDASQDQRAIYLQLASAIGMAEYMVSGDAQGSNFASLAIAETVGQATLRHWQHRFWAGLQLPVAEAVVYEAIAAGELSPAAGALDIGYRLPPLPDRLFAQSAGAVGALVTASVLDLDTAREHLGFDPEQIRQRLKVDLEDADSQLKALPTFGAASPGKEPGEDPDDESGLMGNEPENPAAEAGRPESGNPGRP